MTVVLKNAFPNRVDISDPNYPWGKGINQQEGVVDSGTPIDATWFNDVEGGKQGLLRLAGIIPSGVPDNVSDSDVTKAIKIISKLQSVGNVVGSFRYGCTVADSEDIVIDNDGDGWKYVGTETLPYAVPVGTDPSAGDWELVKFKLNIFDTVSDMRSYDYSGLAQDTTIEWGGYYQKGDGGGNKGLLKRGDSTSLTDDGGRIFIIVNDAVNGAWIEADIGNEVNIKKFGARGNPFDDTIALSNASKFVKSGSVFDFAGLIVRIIHDGVNNNPFVTGGEPNRTSYCFLEKLDNVKFQNGGMYCGDLDMSTNSLVVVGMAGCKFPVFDNFHIIVQASGIPSYDVNGYETFASLITLEHHEDGTLSQGLTIRPNCTFMINHPNGGSIGAQESNPVHDYSGKLVGIEARGNTTLGDNFIITDNDIQGINFYNSTGRLIWMWHSKRNTVKNNKFYLCGKNDNEFCNYGIRVTHYGSDSDYDDNIFEECHMTSAGILVSNNNSLRNPSNYSVNNNKAKDCTRFDIGFNGGANAQCNGNQFENVVAPFAHIRFIEQTNSEWGQFQVKGNTGKNVSVLNPSAEATGFIYNSAANPLLLDIDETQVDGCDARAAITLRFQPQNIRRSNIKNCTDYGIYYGTGITGMNIKDNEIEDCQNNYAIGGFADSQGVFKRNDIKRCFKGLRAGNGSEVYGGKIEDCTETHLEIRNSIAKGVSIEDGVNTSPLQSAILVQGAGSELIAECLIRNSGNFSRGINSAVPSLVVNNGIFGSYSVAPIDGGSVTKLNNYNESGVII